MKTFYLSLFAAAFAFTASAGVTETFTSGQGDWALSNNATATVADGHLNVTMGVQDGTKYRADLTYSKEFTVSPEEKVIAIKFIGTRPDGNLTLDMPDNGLASNIKNSKSILTSAGNTIYYWEINPTSELTQTKIQFKIADCVKEPHSYSVDWIKFYPSVEALTADKDWKDDGDNDQDEVSVLPSPVQIEGKDGYPTLADAWNAAVDGDVIVLNEDQTINDRVNGKSECSITIKAGKANTISRASGYKGILILANNGGTTILEDLTIDGADIPVTGSTLEQNKGNLNLKNVTLKNVNGSGDKGYIVIMGGGNAAIENLTVENCTPAAATKADVLLVSKV